MKPEITGRQEGQLSQRAGRKIAVADWDNTLRDGFTVSDWTRFLSRRDLFSRDLANEVESTVQLYSMGEISYKRLAQKTASLYVQGLRGRHVGDVALAATDFAASDLGVFDFVSPLSQSLRDAGIMFVLISGSPREPLAAFGDLIGFSEIYAFTVTASAGQYTERLSLNPTLEDEKARIMSALSDQFDVILAIGDSAADLPLLEAAPHSVIVGNADLTPRGNREIYHLSPKSDPTASAVLQTILRQAIGK